MKVLLIALKKNLQKKRLHLQSLLLSMLRRRRKIRIPKELLSQIYRLRKSTKLLSGMVSPAEKCKDCTIFNDVASIIPWKFSMNVTIAKIRRLLNRGNTGLIVLLPN